MMTSDAVVVLGCRVRHDGSPSDALQRRIAGGASAWRSGAAPLVLLSGGRRWWGMAEAVVMQRQLVSLGIPNERLHLELCSLSTRENARYCWRRALTLGVTRITLVTCDYHMPRALRHFEANGFVCTAWPAASPQRGRLPPWQRALRLVRALRV